MVPPVRSRIVSNASDLFCMFSHSRISFRICLRIFCVVSRSDCSFSILTGSSDCLISLQRFLILQVSCAFSFVNCANREDRDSISIISCLNRYETCSVIASRCFRSCFSWFYAQEGFPSETCTLHIMPESLSASLFLLFCRQW